MAPTFAPAAIPEDVIESLELLLFGAIGMTTIALADASASDLTLSQWRALVVIGRAGNLRVGDVAVRIGTSLPSTSRLIGRLERRGYVHTERDERDKRATLVTLTARGMGVRSAVIARRRELMTTALSTFPTRLPADLSGGLATLAKAFDSYE